MNRHVALAMDYLNPYARDVAEGVARYCSLKGNWRIYAPYGSPSIELSDLVRWQGHGVIGLLDSHDMEHLAMRGIPAINVFGRFGNLPLNSVVVDNMAIGGLAAEHFIGKGFERFAYSEWETVTYDQSLKRQGFRQRLDAAGFECMRLVNSSDLKQFQGTENDLPVAVFAEEDFVGRLIIEACLDSDLRVPEDVAVLGVNNCRFTCEMLFPPMSSIELGAVRIGFEAARRLEAMIEGQGGDGPVMLEPEGIVQRHSTDVLAISDMAVRNALHFIRDHAVESINVSDVVAASGVGRRTLEKHFREKARLTIHEEIRRLRVLHARNILKETDLSIEEVAVACGYASRDRFYDAFLKECKVGPSRFRQQFRFATEP